LAGSATPQRERPDARPGALKVTVWSNDNDFEEPGVELAHYR
jgi:hypothetical protein